MKSNRPGVIIGRFQVPKLHTGHKYLINYVRERHARTIIIVGVPSSLATEHDPLSFDLRKEMIEKQFRDVIVLPLADHPSDEAWSENLDQLLKGLDQNCTLYGSRDCFASVYSGNLKIEIVPELPRTNGTKERQKIKERPKNGRSFREGAIYQQLSREPIAYPTVDTAVVDYSKERILLGGKTCDGGKLRFLGGFVEPTDTSLEFAACREIHEEVGLIEINDFRYVGSVSVDDWRYRRSHDKILTSFFRVNFVFGAAKASDDIDLCKWVPYNELLDVLVPEHLPLGEMLLKELSRGKE